MIFKIKNKYIDITDYIISFYYIHAHCIYIGNILQCATCGWMDTCDRSWSLLIQQITEKSTGVVKVNILRQTQWAIWFRSSTTDNYMYFYIHWVLYFLYVISIIIATLYFEFTGEEEAEERRRRGGGGMFWKKTQIKNKRKNNKRKWKHLSKQHQIKRKSKRYFALSL